ncbi:MAG: DUF1735 and LamG domain-containing protein [Bacteroides sp.]|uniref:DUF1735 and LamG domain-containing protein n=1 Tax=Bacteroides sp. TaxID=29523 RepID=UPI002FC5F824
MKMNYLTNFYKVLALAGLLVSCDAPYTPIANNVYFAEAQNVDFKKITVAENGASTSLFVRMAAVQQKEVEVSIAVDKVVLDNYNRKNGTNYLLLPDTLYSLEATTTKIKQGEVSSNPVNVAIKALDKRLEVSEKYAIPLKINSAKGAELLEASSSIVLLIDKVIATNVLFMKAGARINYALTDENQGLSDLEQYTIEFLTYSESYGKNKHILSFGAPTGKVGLFARFGEFDHPYDEIQIKPGGAPIYGPSRFEPKRWYHVALTYDGSLVKLYQNGKLDVSSDSPTLGEKHTWRTIMFTTGNAGSLSEIRIWKVARTQTQISENMYAVNPKSEGLELYWKLDEGEGTIVKDYTGNGHNSIAPSGTWQEQKFPPEY